MPALTYKQPDGNDRTLVFGDKPLVIGRLLDSDLPVRDSFMSRVHCGISYANNQFTLKDLGSTNGTYRNGARVFECQLASGDKIQTGNTTLVFEIDTATGNAVLRAASKLTAAPKVTLGPPIRPMTPSPVGPIKVPGVVPPVHPSSPSAVGPIKLPVATPPSPGLRKS